MSWLLAYNIAAWVIRIAMAVVILRRRVAPAVALAWLVIVFLEPLIGLILYVLFGDNRLGRKKVRMHRSVCEMLGCRDQMTDQLKHVIRPEINDALEPVINQAERIGGMPVLGGNHVDLFDENTQLIDRLIADIDDAQHHVHLLYYIFEPDHVGRRVADALVRAVKRGVPCRVLADAVGSRQLLVSGAMGDWMIENKIDLRPALPVNPFRRGLARLDLRNHRKLAVIDGKIAYTGSQNITGEDISSRRAGAWVDLSGRFTGPVVSQLQAVFVEDWTFETEQTLDTPDIMPTPTVTGDIAAQTVPTAPGDDSQTLPRVLLSAINRARRRVIITTPYFVPDEPTVWAIQMAAERRVHVDVVIPAKSDHLLVDLAARSHFGELMESGVKIHLYQPGVLHMKAVTVDDDFSLLGSSNIDVRSFYLNFELNVLMYGPEVTRQLRYAQSKYISDSEMVDHDVWSRRSPGARMLSRAGALMSPLL